MKSVENVPRPIWVCPAFNICKTHAYEDGTICGHHVSHPKSEACTAPYCGQYRDVSCRWISDRYWG